MARLLIDTGNSNVKTAIGVNDKIFFFKRFGYDKSKIENSFLKIIREIQSIKRYNDKLKKIDAIGISLLDLNLKKKINEVLKNKFSTKIIFINKDLKLPFKINYSIGIGNDRIANSAGALMNDKIPNVLIIDFGTATTFTLIIKKVLIGGMISPGIETSFNALINNTSLPVINLKFPMKPVNDNTTDNIRAGIFFPTLYSAERIITDLRKKYKNLFVISTGGFGELFFKRSKLIDRFDNTLSLKGINNILKLNLN
jgi:type III pantothenate kinase